MSAPEAWGPTVAGGRRRRWPRLLRWLATLCLILIVVVGVVGTAVVLLLPREEVRGLARGGSPQHVLLIGSDSRAELTAEERRELSTGSDVGERADTLMVLTVAGGRAALLSLPRDLWVTRCDGSTGRINAAIQLGGTSCLVSTVQALTGLPIHHTAVITFGGFRDLVDAVGGVELCLPEPINDRDAGIDLPAGCQRLDGADALGYVRVRKIDDDFARMERQQTFVQALAREIATPATLLNPVRWVQLGRGAGQTVTVNRGFGPLAALRVGWGGRGLATGAVATHTVPGDPRITSGGAWVLDPRQPDAEQLFARFRDGSVLAEARPDDQAAPAALPAPSEVRVTVLNGAGVAGLAGDTAARLESQGYLVVGVGNSDRVTTSVVRHPPAEAAAAARLATDLDLPTEAVAGVDGVTLLLGEDQR